MSKQDGRSHLAYALSAAIGNCQCLRLLLKGTVKPGLCEQFRPYSGLQPLLESSVLYVEFGVAATLIISNSASAIAARLVHDTVRVTYR